MGRLINNDYFIQQRLEVSLWWNNICGNDENADYVLV